MLELIQTKKKIMLNISARILMVIIVVESHPMANINIIPIEEAGRSFEGL
jgi:hypothetical protein